MSQKTKSLVGGISILGLAGLICKVVGVLYRIPLAHLIDPMGMAIYHKGGAGTDLSQGTKVFKCSRKTNQTFWSFKSYFKKQSLRK